jgi:hypothetical protein
MLRPTKHSHPDRTVISVALLLLARLPVSRARPCALCYRLNLNAVDTGGQQHGGEGGIRPA